MERIGAKHLLDSALRMATPNRGLFLVAIVVVVVLPTLNAALIPFADLVAFSHLNSFPSKLSYGPIHYYVVEMTYIVPHLISRTLLDFGIPASQQVFFYYALQVVFWAGFASLMIHRFAGNLRAAIVFQIWGILVAYDGLFIWGGPLAWSLSAIPTVALLLLATTKYPYSNSALSLIYCGLPIVAMVAHPFAIVPLMMVLVVLWLERVNGRWWPTLSAAIVVMLALLIAKDSPENPTAGMSWIQVVLNWFMNPIHMLDRIPEYLTWDYQVAEYLLGGPLRWYRFYAISIASIKLIGIALSPALYWLVERSHWRSLRPYLLLNWIAFGYYLVAADYAFRVSNWPHRNLLTFASLQFAVGAATILYLGSAAASRLGPALASLPQSRFPARSALAGVTLLIVVALWTVNSEIMRKGDAIVDNYRRLFAAVTASVPDHSVITLSGVEFIAPWSLRAVPFLLFDDASLIARNIVTITEWHRQGRHNSRFNPYATAQAPHLYSVRFRAQEKPGRMEFDVVQVR